MGFTLMTPAFYVIIISYGPNKGKKWHQKICGPKVKVKVMVSSPSRLLRFSHLLLQFSTHFDNSFCILFTIRWTSFLLLRIFNFYLRTDQNGTAWKLANFFFTNFKIKWPLFCFGKKFKILSNKKLVHPIVKRMQKELSKSVKNCRRRWWIRKSLPWK